MPNDDKKRDLDEPIKIDLDPEDALRGLLAVDPDVPTANAPCPKTWNGKACKLTAGHLGPCQYDV